jgi:hypothetical protein
VLVNNTIGGILSGFLLIFLLPNHIKVGAMPLKGILLSVMMGFFFAIFLKACPARHYHQPHGQTK